MGISVKVVYSMLKRLENHLRATRNDIEYIKLQLARLESPRPIDISDINEFLLSLPDHLRKSILALIRIGQGSAADIAHITGRARAVESSYLNQLVLLGKAKKKGVRKRREGRRVVFYL